MRYLWYTLSMLTCVGSARLLLSKPLFSDQVVSQARSLGIIVGALLLPVIFFLLGRRASRKAQRGNDGASKGQK
ncbi:MAG: hypothetical protein LBD42_00795 [Desulfovibrio sp.]|jgi:hypothetical protein|nr:hypothetical protein [Desulfovibrio sp.]